MKVELLAVTPNAQKLIEKCARTCYDSESKMKEGGSKLVKGCVKRGHLSILGHAQATFRVSGVSRALTHQLVRHRIAVFSQRSQRYVKEGAFEYVIPLSATKHDNKEEFKKDMKILQTMYDKYKTYGWTNEDARFLLPNACTSIINVTMNFQSLLNFFKLRLDSHAQWEIRKMAEEMWNLIQPFAPQVFNKECLEAVVKPKIDWDNLK